MYRVNKRDEVEQSASSASESCNKDEEMQKIAPITAAAAELITNGK